MSRTTRNEDGTITASTPVTFDTLFPEKGTPVGFGYIAIVKDPQMYIDKLSQNILENAMMVTRPRFWASETAGVNVEDFKNWSNPIVKVQGTVDENRLKQISITPLNSIYLEVMQEKINELKEVSSNRDFTSGGTASGVTAAAAIAALQEAGNKCSRDMIAASYRAYTQINYQSIELIRQFYDETRTFRITGQMAGQHEFIGYNNANIKDQMIQPTMPGGEPMYRKPVFDIKIKAQKRNPFSQMSQNEMAKELYGMGFFNPQKAQEAQGALELMEFEGKDKVIRYVQQGQTLLNIVQKMSVQLDQMAAYIQAITGFDMGVGGGQPKGAPKGAGAPSGQPMPSGGGQSLASSVQQAQTTNATGYMQKLSARSKPNMNIQNGPVVK